MSVNRELLELAARAAGIDGVYESWCYMGFNEGIRLASKAYRPWNSLTDAGDALRLLTGLRLSLIPIEGGGWDVHQYDPESCIETLLGTDDDPKRAITRAAADIGSRAVAAKTGEV